MSNGLDRVILEMGSGVSVRSENYTRAACRAVEDAIHHSSLSFVRELGLDFQNDLVVEVTIGVQDPSAVDIEVVGAVLAARQGVGDRRQRRIERAVSRARLFDGDRQCRRRRVCRYVTVSAGVR